MSEKSRPLSDLPNLGAKIAARLRDSGIVSTRQLAQIGPPAAYHRLCERAGRRLPRCYYLYSLEGALRGVHWTDLSTEEKRRLGLAVSELSTVRPRRRRPLRRR